MAAALALISHQHGKVSIEQRAHDGYFNATAMAKAAKKLFADYDRLKSTNEFLETLSSSMGIPIHELVQTLMGSPDAGGGTWVHPQVAVHLAQWLSPEFAVKVSKWVYEWVSSNGRENSEIINCLQKQSEAIMSVANSVARVDGSVARVDGNVYHLTTRLDSVDNRLGNLEQIVTHKGKRFGKKVWNIWAVVIDKFHGGFDPIEGKVKIRENGTWINAVEEHWRGRATGANSVKDGLPTTQEINLRLRDSVFREKKEPYFRVFQDHVDEIAELLRIANRGRKKKIFIGPDLFIRH